LNSLKIEFNMLEDDDLLNLKWLDQLKFITVKYNQLSKDIEDWFVEFNEKQNNK